MDLIPGLLCAAAFVVLAVAEGGFEVTSWGPAGLFLLGLLVAVSVAYRRRLRELQAATRIALAFLAAFVVWNFASIVWADVPGVAWDGANRTLIYLMVYAIFSLVLWRPSSAGVVLAAYSIGLAVVGAGALLEAAGAADAELSFIGARFAEPTGYANAVAALFIGGFWPALFLGSRRETPWPARGLLLAVAGLLIQLALIPQSRGSLIVLPLAVLIYLAVVPNRLRALLFLILVGGATALVAAPILDVFEVAAAEGDIGTAMAEARDGIIVSFVALLVAGTAVAALDRRLSAPESVARASGRVAAALAVAAAVVAVGVGTAAIGDPIGWADDRWRDFKADYDDEGFGSSRFSGDLGSNRYDFWRVVVEDGFTDAPVAGAGADNFAVTYLQNRESGEEPLYPHSLPFRVLAGTGIVGLLLFVGFAVAAAVAAGRARLRARDSFTRGLAGVAVAAAAYFALHSSGDWFWTFVGITAPAFAWLGMAGSLVAEAPERAAAVRERDRPSRWGRLPRIMASAVALAAAVFALASLLLPWVAARDIEQASAGWGADPKAAFERLDRARGLNFLSARADLVAGAIAIRREDDERAREAFTRALEREPQSWYALLELGALDAVHGRRASALARLEQAASLNPGDPLIAGALQRVQRGQPFSPQRIERNLLDRVCARVGSTDETRYCK